MAKQADETKHSPTPWHGLAALFDGNDRWIGDMTNKYDHDFVLHCVNTHDKLVDACRATLKHLSTSSKLDWDGELTAIIEAALAEEQK